MLTELINIEDFQPNELINPQKVQSNGSQIYDLIDIIEGNDEVT